MEEKIIKLPNSISMEDRKNIRITGVTDVGSFDEDAISLLTSYGGLNIRGENIQITQLNIEKGEVAASGEFRSFEYTDAVKKNGGFFSRLFE